MYPADGSNVAKNNRIKLGSVPPIIPMDRGPSSLIVMHSIQALATVLAAAALAVPPASAIPYKNGRAYDAVKQKRELPGRNGLTVDLGYEVYEGFNNASTGINSWLG